MLANTRLGRVAIVGGTHGNELTGAYLIKYFQQYPDLVQRPALETITLLGNPRALEARTRYVEKDLNRAFLSQDLQNPDLTTLEDIRAKEIAQILGNQEKPQVDFIVDIHSTTSNMQFTIIIGNEDPVVLRLVAYLSSINPLVKIFSWSTTQKQSFLRSLCPRSIAIEIGAIPHGVVDAGFFVGTKELIGRILDFLNNYYEHGSKLQSIATTVDLYEGKAIVDYPRNDHGELAGMVHPKLIGQDYQPLQPGEPMFVTFEGEEINYQGDSIVYPVFINESSYLEKAIAMVLCQKKTIQVN